MAKDAECRGPAAETDHVKAVAKMARPSPGKFGLPPATPQPKKVEAVSPPPEPPVPKRKRQVQIIVQGKPMCVEVDA